MEDGTLDNHVIIPIDIQKMTVAAVEGTGVSNKEAVRCKNMWALGLMCWMYDRDRKPTIDWLEQRFGKRAPEVAAANIAALNAGHAYVCVFTPERLDALRAQQRQQGLKPQYDRHCRHRQFRLRRTRCCRTRHFRRFPNRDPLSMPLC